MTHIMNRDDAFGPEWDDLIAKLRAAGHEVDEALAISGDHFLVRVPIDGRLCSYPEAVEVLRIRKG